MAEKDCRTSTEAAIFLDNEAHQHYPDCTYALGYAEHGHPDRYPKREMTESPLHFDFRNRIYFQTTMLESTAPCGGTSIHLVLMQAGPEFSLSTRWCVEILRAGTQKGKPLEEARAPEAK